MSKHEFFTKGLIGKGMVHLQNPFGASIICTVAELKKIAAKGNIVNPMATARPTQQQAQQALDILGLQMN